MRKLRILIVIIFILSCGAFAGYIFMDRTKSDNTPPVNSFDSDTVSVTLKTEDEEGNEIDADRECSAAFRSSCRRCSRR